MLSLAIVFFGAASAMPVVGQLNPLFHQPLQDGRQATNPSSTCPNGHPVASVALPSPLPNELNATLWSLKPMLEASVDHTFPTASGRPQAAALQLDYRGDKLVQFFAGDKDPKVKAGLPDETTIFRIGSVSKVFAVLVAYQLYDRGVVKSLDDPLSAYAPEFEMPNVYSHSKRRFTLRQLASQLSGMQREGPCNMLDCHINTSEVIRRLKTFPGAMWPEYTEASYSNLAYALLGNILAEYTGTSYAAYVKKNILEPLSMQDTGFVFTDKVKERMARPYVNETFVPNTDLGYIAPAGQMYSTIQDLMKLLRYYLGIAGELFDDGLRRELLAPSFLARDGAFLIGSPWEAQFLNGTQRWTMLGKGGNIMGHSAVIGIIPELNLSFSALWSGAMDETTFVAEAYESILPAFVAALKSQRPPLGLPRAPMKYVGTYHAEVGSAVRVKNATVGGAPALQFIADMNGMELSFLLDFFDDHAAALVQDVDVFPENCFIHMALALINSWCTFDLGPDGAVLSMESPGNAYGTKWRRMEGTEISTPEALPTLVI